MTAKRTSPGKRHREHRAHGCWDHLIAAPLWVAFDANLGTLLRTCDAVGACMAVPKTEHYRRALDKGDTLPKRPHTHWVRSGKTAWVRNQRAAGRHVIAVEVSDDALPLPLLEPATGPTIVLLGHEHHGLPDDTIELADQVIQIPMIGRGASLNVAVAGSLVLYRLAGLS